MDKWELLINVLIFQVPTEQVRSVPVPSSTEVPSTIGSICPNHLFILCLSWQFFIFFLLSLLPGGTNGKKPKVANAGDMIKLDPWVGKTLHKITQYFCRELGFDGENYSCSPAGLRSLTWPVCSSPRDAACDHHHRTSWAQIPVPGLLVGNPV